MREAVPRYLPFLPGFLFDPEQRPLAFILKAWLLVLAGSMVLSALVGLAAPAAEAPDVSVASPGLVALLVIGAPVVETLVMIPPLLLFALLLGPAGGVLASALLWGVLHSLAAPAWGFVAWWPFLIFSIAFLTWRRRGLPAAAVLVMAIHALQNGFAAALLLMLTPALAH